jgi:hypothetical protein
VTASSIERRYGRRLCGCFIFICKNQSIINLRDNYYSDGRVYEMEEVVDKQKIKTSAEDRSR